MVMLTEGIFDKNKDKYFLQSIRFNFIKNIFKENMLHLVTSLSKSYARFFTIHGLVANS